MPGTIVLIAAAALLVAPEGTDPLIVKLQAKLDQMTSLKARFVQRLDSSMMADSRTEEGRLFLRKPSLMRWEYEKPERKLAIADGKDTWLYIPADRQVQKGTIRDLEDEGALSLLLSGRINLVKDFRSRRLAEGEAPLHGAAWAVAIELTPVKKRIDVDKVILVMNEDRLLVRSLTIVDSDGDRMVLELFDLDENPDLADSLFRFRVPPGVDLLTEN